MKKATIYWELKCATCGLTFSVLFYANETNENKRIIRECPCGVLEPMKIIKEIKTGGKNDGKVH